MEKANFYSAYSTTEDLNDRSDEYHLSGQGDESQEIPSRNTPDEGSVVSAVQSVTSSSSSIPASSSRGRSLARRTKPEKLENTSTLFPDGLPPFSHPKESFSRSLVQLESPEWDVIIDGLRGIVILARHHPKVLLTSAHICIVQVVRQIKNLRSQVARAAVHTAHQIFLHLGRSIDQEVEDLGSALLTRTADTNRFLRADSALALNAMVDNASPLKCVSTLINRGAKHQNAVVRGETCRLVLRMCHQLGAQKIMALPKDMRDGIIITSAKCLTEGNLDTRNYAKEIIIFLSADSRLRTIMNEVVPTNVMRSITKVLNRLPGLRR